MYLPDAYSSNSSQLKPIKPFHAVNLQTERDEWLLNAFLTAQAAQKPLAEEAKSNWDIYSNDHSRLAEKADNNRDRLDSDTYYRLRKPRVVANDLYELVENRVSKLVSFIPSTIPVPATNDLQDKNAAKAVKKLLQGLRYKLHLPRKYESAARESMIAGESYFVIRWDPCAGDLDPEWVKAKERGKKIKDPESGEMVDPEDLPEDVRRIGDVVVDDSYRTEDVFLQPASCSEDVNWCMLRKLVHIDDLKAQYPDKAHEIEATKNVYLFNSDFTNERAEVEDHALVVEFFHDRTQFLPEGYYIKFTPDMVLEEEDEIPYPRQDAAEFGALPICRVRDIRRSDELHGISSFRQLWPLQFQKDKLTTANIRNAIISSVPILMVDRASKPQITRDPETSVVTMTYSGSAQPPKLGYHNVQNPQNIAYEQQLTEKMQVLSGTHGISRGDPPSGIRAGVALRLLEQVENQRARNIIEEFNRFVLEVDQKILAVVGKYYQKDDGRMVRLLGRGNEHQIVAFNASVLSNIYDVRLERVSGLSQNIAARSQELIDYRQLFPNVVTDEFFADSLGLVQPEKIKDQITVAVTSAESENEDFADNTEVPDPGEWEEHEVHWRSHMKLMQTRSFKQDWSEEQRRRVIDHVMTHEFLMAELARQNPSMFQRYFALPGWPRFFKLPDELIQTIFGGGQAPASVDAGAQQKPVGLQSELAPPDTTLAPERRGDASEFPQ